MSQSNLEVVFRKIPYSESLEGFIREQAEKLQKLLPGAYSLRVTIDATNKRRKNHEHFSISTLLSRKGHSFAVHREIDVNKKKGAIYLSVRHCFQALHRRVMHQVEKRRSAKSFNMQSAAEWQPADTQIQTIL